MLFFLNRKKRFSFGLEGRSLELILGLCLATATAGRVPAKAAPVPTPEAGAPTQVAPASQERFIAALVSFRPGRTTQGEVARRLVTPETTRTEGKKTVFAYKLYVKPGLELYDVFLTFLDQILIQVERPLVEVNFSETLMRRRYGRPESIELRPAKGALPSRTLFHFSSHGRTFIRTNNVKKLTALIEYVPSQVARR